MTDADGEATSRARTTVGDWPLNVFDEGQAAAELRVLRAVASADLHNLVFQRDYRIIPAIVNGWAPRQHA
jgi:hypothetical protein